MTGLRPEGCGRLTAAGYVPTGETTHYDLCVAGAPSNHVRCASLRSGGDSACGAEGCGLPLCGNTYKVSVTGFPFLYHMTCFPPGGKGTGFAGSRRRLRIQRHASQRTRWWRQPPKGDTPEWYMKYMTRCFFPHISRFPLRWQRNWIHRGAPRPANPVTCFPPGRIPAKRQRVYGAELRNDTPPWT